MNKIIKSTLVVLLFFTSSIAIANTHAISVELLSYEQKEDHCALTYSISNNSWGTMYGIRIKTEAFDDRDTVLKGHAFGTAMNPFAGFWDTLVSIPKGGKTTSSDLKYKGQCKFIGTINVLGIDVNDCNIRMMPEEAKCSDIVEYKSNIDHITLRNK
jgi:hypothetical protein